MSPVLYSNIIPCYVLQSVIKNSRWRHKAKATSKQTPHFSVGEIHWIIEILKYFIFNIDQLLIIFTMVCFYFSLTNIIFYHQLKPVSLCTLICANFTLE